MKAVIFGAGNIARGVLGPIFMKAGYRIVFVEIDQQIIRDLKRGFYRVKIANRKSDIHIIKGVTAINAEDIRRVTEEVEQADIVASGVGVKNISSIIPLILKGMRKRTDIGTKKPLNILICENLSRPAEFFRGLISQMLENSPKLYREYVDSHLGLVGAVVSRMVCPVSEEIRKKDPTFTVAEKFNELILDRKEVKGEIPKLEETSLSENFGASQEQKLFTNNTGHAICAYLGYLKNYRYIWQAIEDREIYKVVRDAMRESGKGLVKKYKIEWQKQEKKMDEFLHRLKNRVLEDTIIRVGRDPIRKLGNKERLIGAAKLAYQYGIMPRNICYGIAAALLFSPEKDSEAKILHQMLTEKGPESVLRELCQIDPRSKLALLVKERYDILKRKG